MSDYNKENHHHEHHDEIAALRTRLAEAEAQQGVDVDAISTLITRAEAAEAQLAQAVAFLEDAIIFEGTDKAWRVGVTGWLAATTKEDG